MSRNVSQMSTFPSNWRHSKIVNKWQQNVNNSQKGFFLMWCMITKDTLIKSSTQVFKAAGLEAVFGHSYHIGGSLDLLLASVTPKIIIKLGGWTSLCFLLYWRHLEHVIPSLLLMLGISLLQNLLNLMGWRLTPHLSTSISLVPPRIHLL
jgi:hypothetical protein